MGQRQPHGADLLPARKEAVENPPRHDEVGAGVPMAQRQAQARVVKRGGRASEHDGDGDEKRHGRVDVELAAERAGERAGSRRGQGVF